MNTSKQINAMIILLAALLIGIGAYTVWDPTRQQDEQKKTLDLIGMRAAQTYVRNCRVCHGDDGEGRIGPALNPALRQSPPAIAFTDPAKIDENRILVTNTIACGRVGTRMPSWATDQGGSLNSEQIRQLVILITTPSEEKLWDEVKKLSEEENAAGLTPVPVQEVPTNITGATGYVCGQKPIGTAAAGGAAAPAAGTPGTATTSWTEDATDNKFAQTSVTIEAGKQITLTFNNKGQAIHNVHVQGVKDASGKDIATDLIGGGQSRTVTFTISQKGEYKFICDVHPAEMTGTLFVQ